MTPMRGALWRSLRMQAPRVHAGQQRAMQAERVSVWMLSSRHASTAAERSQSHRYEWAKTDMPPPSPGRGILGRSANFDVTNKAESIENYMWLFKMLGFFNEDDRLYRDSTRILTSAINHCAQPEFYRALHLTPNFRGQQALLMAHMWIVHRRLGMEDEHGKVLQEVVFDRLWEETVVRIRFQNVSELTVNKHLAEVQQVCFNACLAYDRGMKEGPGAMQQAVAKHLLVDESPQGMRVASTMAEYMKRELKSLEKVDAKHIFEGTIPWGPHPQPTSNSPPFDDEYMLIGRQYGQWRSALDNRGKLYFWNQQTRYSVWTLDEAKQLDAKQSKASS